MRIGIIDVVDQTRQKRKSGKTIGEKSRASPYPACRCLIPAKSLGLRGFFDFFAWFCGNLGGAANADVHFATAFAFISVQPRRRSPTESTITALFHGFLASRCWARIACLYQSSFNANWICREVVEVLVMTPAVGDTPEGVNTTRFGVLKLARLRILKNSARN
jgi:hypothetical protein